MASKLVNDRYLIADDNVPAAYVRDLSIYIGVKCFSKCALW